MSKRATREFIDWLKNQMSAHDWGIRETARRADVSHTSISNIINLEEQPTFETCKALAKAFDVSPIFVLELAGQLPKGDKPIGFDEWMGLIEGVPPEEVRRMIEIARTMRGQAMAKAKKK